MTPSRFSVGVLLTGPSAPNSKLRCKGSLSETSPIRPAPSVVTLPIREFAIELARNAFAHGNASIFSMSIESHRIVLRDNGPPFSHSDMYAQIKQRGGTAALKHVTGDLASELVYSYLRDQSENVTILARIRSPDKVYEITPCCAQLTFDDETETISEDSLAFCEAHRECETIYIVPGGISYSDIEEIAWKFAARLVKGQKLVLVCSDISSGLERYIEKIAPDVRIMNLTTRR